MSLALPRSRGRPLIWFVVEGFCVCLGRNSHLYIYDLSLPLQHLGAKPSTIMEEDGDDSVVMALAKKPRPSILKKAAHPLPSGKGNSASARKPVHPMDKLRDLSARIEDDPGSVSDAVVGFLLG